MYHFEGVINFIVILIFVTKEIKTETGAVLSMKFLCYKNFGHLNIDGQMCDVTSTKLCNPYFRFCISNKPILGKLKPINCPVYYFKSSTFNYKEIVCHEPTDNRNSLMEIMEANVPFPIQDSYFIKINVKDGNEFSTNHRYIAYFSHVFRGAPFPYDGNVSFIEARMTRFDKNVKNANVSLTIGLSMRCIRNSNSNNCSSQCQYHTTDNFICSSDGTKICKPGKECFKLESKKTKPVSTAVLWPVILLIVFVIIISVLTIIWFIRKTKKNVLLQNVYTSEQGVTRKSLALLKYGKNDNVYEDTYDIDLNGSSVQSLQLVHADESTYVDMNQMLQPRQSLQLPALPPR